MKKLKIVFGWLTLSIFMLGSAASIKACMGAVLRSVCEQFSGADAVVIGTVEDIKPDSIKFSDDLDLVAQRVKIKVTKSFKGIDQEYVSLVQPSWSCEFKFKESDKGKDFLFYIELDKQNGEYKVVQGSRSRQIEYAFDDLAWLDGLPKSLGRTRLSGVLRHHEYIQKEGTPEVELVHYLTGAKVTIYGKKKTFSTVTDKNGMYEFWDIPPGKYNVVPELPANYTIDFKSPYGIIEYIKLPDGDLDFKDFRIKVPKGGCAGVDYNLNKTE